MKRLTAIVILILLTGCSTEEDSQKKPSDPCFIAGNASARWEPVEFKQINNYDWTVDLERGGLVFDWWPESVLVRDMKDLKSFTGKIFSYNDYFPFVVTNTAYNWDLIRDEPAEAAARQALYQSCFRLLENNQIGNYGVVRAFTNLSQSNDSLILYPIPNTWTSDKIRCGDQADLFEGVSMVYEPFWELDRSEICRPVFNSFVEDDRFILHVMIYLMAKYERSERFLSIISLDQNGEGVLRISAFPMISVSAGSYIFEEIASLQYADAYISLPDKYRNYQFGFKLLTDPELCPAVE